MIQERVKVVATKVLDLEVEPRLESNLIHDLGADSLDMAELVLCLEDEFDIWINDVEIENIETIGEIVEYIKENI
jgi:acyl carrier protein|tara:strand:- start:253 stop:477 length:225 start_codon:yes stop_codon:yes gene_type:complete